MSGFLSVFLISCCVILGISIIFCMIRSIRGPRFTDRIVAVNMTGTATIGIVTILAVLLEEDFLIDISVTYALLSFIAVVVLTRLVIIRRRGQIEREKHLGPDEVNELKAGEEQ